MAIVKMNKFTLLTFESQKQQLLKKLQAFQNVQFIDLQNEAFLEKNEELTELQKDTTDATYAQYEDYLSKAGFALEFLKKFAPSKKEAKKEGRRELTLEELEEKVTSGDWNKHYEEIKSYEDIKNFDEKLKAIENEKTQLESEIQILQNWTGFDASFSQIKELKNTSYLLGTVSTRNEEEFLNELNDCQYVHTEVINKNSQDTYIFALVGEEDEDIVEEITKTYGFNHFMTTQEDTPAKIIENSHKKIEELKTEEKTIGERIQSFDGLVEEFELVYEYYYNLLERQKASSNFLKTNETVLMSGWVPVEDNHKVEEIVKEAVGSDYYLSFEGVKEEETKQVPIKLKNGVIASKFESLTKMYSLPKYDEIDPTPLLVPFYLIFFGMMVADAGYGVVMLIATILAPKFMNLNEGMKNFMKFFFWLSIPTIFFGLLYGSIFGDIIPMEGLIDPNRDINTLLIMSIGFGLIHIFCGLGIKAYMLIRDGKPLDAFFDSGSWVLTLVGAIIFGVSAMTDILGDVGTIGMVIMFVGMAMIVLTQGRKSKSVGGKVGGGLYALFGITNYVGDIVSYTRLMALGLAGGSIASAMNLIMNFFPGAALFIIGPIFFVAAHTFNIFLSLLGAYVHSCRLQYVEYFGKFYEGGGKEFAPFKTLEKYVDLKDK